LISPKNRMSTRGNRHVYPAAPTVKACYVGVMSEVQARDVAVNASYGALSAVRVVYAVNERLPARMRTRRSVLIVTQVWRSKRRRAVVCRGDSEMLRKVRKLASDNSTVTSLKAEIGEYAPKPVYRCWRTVGIEGLIYVTLLDIYAALSHAEDRHASKCGKGAVR